MENILLQLMKSEVFSAFRLVGGTSLSLQIGHRISVDIDLFTDAEYGTVDFYKIENYLKTNFPYVDYFSNETVSFGKSYTIGNSKEESIKLDIFYTDKFINNCLLIDGLRLATVDEIVAMKLDVVQRLGRKKDFWDLHDLLDEYTLAEMLALHKLRYPYTHDEKLLIKNLTDFSEADEDFDPICLKGKYWEFIKEDISAFVAKNLQSPTS